MKEAFGTKVNAPVIPPIIDALCAFMDRAGISYARDDKFRDSEGYYHLNVTDVRFSDVYILYKDTMAHAYAAPHAEPISVLCAPATLRWLLANSGAGYLFQKDIESYVIGLKPF